MIPPNLQPGSIFSIGTTISRITSMPRAMISSTVMRVQGLMGLTRVNPPIPRTRIQTPQITVDAPQRQQPQLQPRKRAVRVRAATKPTFSQIHLINEKTQRRTIVHIGTPVGRVESAVLLGEGGHKPMHLRFVQVNPKQYEAPVLLKQAEGDELIRVDGRDFKSDTPIRYGSVITVGAESYRCELYAWGKQPAIPFIRAHWLTHAGPVRPLNEDAIGIYRHRKASLFAIADGVGGAAAGEEVSQFAVQTLLAMFHRSVGKNVDWQVLLRQTVTSINAEVRHFGSVSVVETGTTLTAVVIQGWDAYVVHIGDSRLYHWSARTLYQVTTDHSAFAASKELGGRRISQKRSMLTKAIGKADTIEPDIFQIHLQPGDRLLLCTDGIHDTLQHEEIGQWMGEDKVIRMPAHLIEIANERYNDDNASAICIETLGHPIEEDTRKIPIQDRVYVGYSWRWRLKLKATEEQITHYPVGRRWKNLALVAGLGLVGIFLLLWMFTLRGA